MPCLVLHLSASACFQLKVLSCVLVLCAQILRSLLSFSKGSIRKVLKGIWLLDWSYTFIKKVVVIVLIFTFLVWSIDNDKENQIHSNKTTFVPRISILVLKFVFCFCKFKIYCSVLCHSFKKIIFPSIEVQT